MFCVSGFIYFDEIVKPEDHWSCIAHLSAEDMLKSAVFEEMKLGSKYDLLDTPCILFVKKYFFCIKLLHAHLQYVCNISSKC